MTSLGCPGGGIAKVCEDKDGPRVTLINHMKLHWNEIGFTPTSFTLDTRDTDEGLEHIENTDFDIPLKENEMFTPNHKKQNPPSQTDCSYNGVVIRNLPLNITEEILKPFLVSKGLPDEHNELKIFATKKNKNVDIENISTATCGTLISSLHEQIFFSRKVYCRGLKNLVTPTKMAPDEKKSENKTDDSSDLETKVDDLKDATPKKDDKETNENTSPLLVPGLSKEESAKAAKKARQLKNKLEKQKGAKNSGKKSKDLDKSDFLNGSNPQPSPEFDQTSQFVFDENCEPSHTDISEAGSKFFQHSPISKDLDQIFLTPGSFSSLTAKKIQKEELWKQQISPKPANAKRPPSPIEDLERKMRSRSENEKNRIPSKLPFLNTAK